MTQYAIVTDLNRCVGCLSCNAACKTANNVPIGNYWNKVLRIGPDSAATGAAWPDVEWYYLPVQCQHCKDAACVEVCPTSASHKLADGTVQVDKAKCIGCQFCAMACPYGVRYLNEEERVVEKCTLCEQQISQGQLPQCVAQCVGMAKWFGDLENGIDSFEGPEDPSGARRVLGNYVKSYSEADLHQLPNAGNNPSFVYILRGKAWQS